MAITLYGESPGSNITTNTANFDNNLSSADDDVQKALDTMDNLAIGSANISAYNAATNTPDLDTSPSGILKGDKFFVTAAGTFFTQDVEVGDCLISKQNDPTVLGDWIVLEGEGQTVFADNVFRVQDDGDATKEIAFQASGITTGTVRTITMADSDVSLLKSSLNESSSPGVNDDNTAGYAVGSLWVDTTADEAFHAVDVSTGAAIWAGISGIGAVVDDTTPQLGGQLDVNGNSIGDGTLELLSFVETASAVNELTVTNAATAGSPSLTATGGDTDIDLTLDGKGTGTVKTLSSNLDVTGNIIVSGTVDGRDLATDGTKLDGVETLADVTDETNVKSSLDGATITAATVAGTDKVLIQDTDDADNLKTVTAQAIADLGSAAQLNWNFSTNTVKADPGSGNFRLNNAVPASASRIYIDNISKDGIDATSVFTSLSVGDKLLIKELGAASKNLLVTITEIAVETGFFQLQFDVDSSGTLFADTNACGFDFLYPDNTVFEKDHIIQNSLQWKTALDETIAKPRKFKNIFRVQKNITLADADKSGGNVGGEIWFIVKTNSETTRPKITDNKYNMTVQNAQLKWSGIDYLMDAADNGIFFTGTNGVSAIYDFSNSDISRNANFPFLEIIDDSYGEVTLDRVTGTDTATTFGKIHLKQNSVGTEKAITDLKIVNGSNLSGVLASADGTVGELNVYVSGSVISNNGNGVWNATNGATINVLYTPDSKVDQTLVAGSSAVTFTEIFKIPGSQITPDFGDDVFRIQDNGDATKEIAFEASAITTGTVRTITMPDQNIDLTPGTGSFATEAEGGLAATALQDIVSDTTPQLGGQLDVNGNSIGDGTLELLSFVETPSAVNEVTITNAATANAPKIDATGGDTNIDLELSGKGTGVVKGNGFQTNLVEVAFAVSDETTALATGVTQFTFRMPFAMTLFAGNAGARMSLVTTPTGSTFTADINETGSTILSTKLTIDAGEDTSLTATTEVVISDVNLADDAKITIDIDAIGSTIAGAGLKIVLRGVRA